MLQLKFVWLAIFPTILSVGKKTEGAPRMVANRLKQKVKLRFKEDKAKHVFVQIAVLRYWPRKDSVQGAV